MRNKMTITRTLFIGYVALGLATFFTQFGLLPIVLVNIRQAEGGFEYATGLPSNILLGMVSPYILPAFLLLFSVGLVRRYKKLLTYV